MSVFEKDHEYALQAQVAGAPTAYIPPTRRQQLEMERDKLQSMLAKIEAALNALDKHPELEEFIDTLQKAGI
jgi:hypothetical protein